MTRNIALTLVVALFLGAVPAVAADGELRISGRLLDIKPDGTVTIEEQGPWLGPNTGLVKRSVVLGPDTSIRLVRAKGTWNPNDASPGYEVTATDFRDLNAGDFVTVITDRGSKAVAIDVMRPDDGGMASPPTSAIGTK